MKRCLVVIAVLALLVPGALLAQGSLPLRGLTEQLTALVKRVDAVERRVIQTGKSLSRKSSTC